MDCRFDLMRPQAGEQAYHDGRIPGSLYAHLDHDLAAITIGANGAGGRHPLPKPAVTIERLGQWGIDRQSEVVVYDDAGGAIALRLWWMLRALGVERVALLDGGIQAWQAAGLPMASGPAQALDANANSEDWRVPEWQMPTLEANALIQGLEEKRLLLLDARARPRFEGQMEPIDARAGHVPGALNRPFTENLDDQGRFKPAAQLHAEFSALFADQREIAGTSFDLGAMESGAAAVAHMCGSGVTACHNLYAMELAGMPGSALYVGSWSDWISDPERQVATH